MSSQDGVALIDALYDEDDETARVDVPPRAWRATRGEIARLRQFAQEQLDAAWQAREALLARLGALQLRHGSELQVAHRKRDSVSHEELRSLIADLESLVDGEDTP